MFKQKKLIIFLLAFCMAGASLYGLGRLYFHVTGGFQLKHISSNFPFDGRWETRQISDEEREGVERILSQPFTYLGKGCQSYVFLSEDKEYVIKFLKYQRFRPQFYLHWFSFLPPVYDILQEKVEKKRGKREDLFLSWRVAFDYLQEETGLVFVHLNKTTNLNKQVKIVDKVGMSHTLNADEVEFLIQRKADMLCDTLDTMMEKGEEGKAKGLLTDLVQVVVREYRNGIADNDHALMQNTGVYKGKPVHIDVGQFVLNDELKEPEKYHQELYNKTWKFRNWLRKRHPVLVTHLENELKNEMGDEFYSIKYIPKR